MTAALAGEGIRGAAAAAAGWPLSGGGGSSSSSTTTSELEALAVKEWILIKWKVVEEQRLELKDEWEAACKRHNRLRGLPDSSGKGERLSQEMGWRGWQSSPGCLCQDSGHGTSPCSEVANS